MTFVLRATLCPLSLVAVLGWGAVSFSQEKPAGTAPAAKAPADPFTPPAGDNSEEIATFVQNMVHEFSTRPAEFRSTEGTVEFLNKMDKALAEVFSRKLNEETAALIAAVRRQVLDVVGQYEDPTAAKRMEEFMTALTKSEHASLRGLASQVEFESKLMKLPEMTAEQRTQLVQDVANRLQEKELAQEALQMAAQVANVLEQLDMAKEAAAANNLYARHLEARGEEKLKDIVDSLKGAARRLDLPGNPIEIKGTTLEGKPFNIDDWKGKVVLVDFWATWCGPCVGEIPNVKHAYEAYHDKGFEVVGVSLDDSPDRLTEFLKEQEIPWTTLFPEDEKERGWENPIARYYGIHGIPTVILVNKEGKVVSLNARGPLLERQLAELLGPVEEPQTGAPKSNGAK